MGRDWEVSAGKAWKQAEKATAARLGGTRTSRAGLGEACADFETSVFAGEVKTRKALPALLRDAMIQAKANARSGLVPLVVLHEKGKRRVNDIVCIRMGDFEALLGNLPTKETDGQG